MSAERYSIVFQSLRRAGQGAFVPFCVLGDPTPDTSLEILDALVDGGADMLELGIPFSDPVADGPTIQAADLRARAAGTTPELAIELLSEFRRRHPGTPVGLLLYANLVLRPGPAGFYQRLSRAGVDSVLIADLPLEEGRPFRLAAEQAGVGYVSMVTPLTQASRLRAICRQPAPYLYAVSRTGVTGCDRSLEPSAARLLHRLRRHSRCPALLGFGVSGPEHVRQALRAGAAGVVCGSAVVEIIAAHAEPEAVESVSGRRRLLTKLRKFTAAMKAATLLNV